MIALIAESGVVGHASFDSIEINLGDTNIEEGNTTQGLPQIQLLL